MANSIVFQNSAEQLKSAVFGYDSSTNSYKALRVNSDGELYVIGGTVSSIGTINYLNQIGTLNYVNQIGTLNYIAPIGTLNYVAQIGTLNYVNQIGTLNYIAPIGTLNYVAQIGTLNHVNQIGTLNYIAPIGTLNYVAQIGTLSYIAPIGTLRYVDQIGTLSNVIGTVKINLVDRIFTSITQTINIPANTSTYSTLINISKYEQTSWYLRNTTPSGRTAVTVQLAATPSTDLVNYPLVLIQETATVNASPRLITNDYYLKYINSKITNPSTSTVQSVVIVLNARY